MSFFVLKSLRDNGILQKASDSEANDTEGEASEESKIEYIYDVGLNNSVGIAEPSITESEETLPNDQNEEPVDGGYDYDEEDGNDYEE